MPAALRARVGVRRVLSELRSTKPYEVRDGNKLLIIRERSCYSPPAYRFPPLLYRNRKQIFQINRIPYFFGMHVGIGLPNSQKAAGITFRVAKGSILRINCIFD